MRLFPGSSLPFHVLMCKGSCDRRGLICLSDVEGYGRSKMQTFLWPPEIQEVKKKHHFFTTKCVYAAHKEGKTSVLWELVWGLVWMFHLHSFDLHLVWQSLRDGACIRQSVGHTHTRAHTHKVRALSRRPPLNLPQAFTPWRDNKIQNRNKKKKRNTRKYRCRVKAAEEEKQARRRGAQDCSAWFRTAPTCWGRSGVGEATEVNWRGGERRAGEKKGLNRAEWCTLE